MKNQQFHEQFDRTTLEKKTSDRSFGFLFFTVFAIIAVYPILQNGSMRIWAICLSGLFFISALFSPRILSLLNHLWQKLGQTLGKITTPLVMGILFYLIMTPFAFCLRKKIRKESVQLGFDATAQSYWIKRSPSDPSSMKQQF